MNRTHRLSLLPYPLALVLAVGLGVAIYLRTLEPTTYRSTWCPSPEDRADASEPPDRSLAKVQVIARLREIRTKLHALRVEGPSADPGDPPVPGTVAELDWLILTLLSDYELSTIPLEEPNPR